MAGHPEADGNEAYATELRQWRERRGYSQKALAELMVYDRSYVSHVEGRNLVPTEGFTRRAEEVLDAGGALWARWDQLKAERAVDGGDTMRDRSNRELLTADFVTWLTEHTDKSFVDIYQDVAVLADRYDDEIAATRLARTHQRSVVTRADLAAAVADYYDLPDSTQRLYVATVAGSELVLSILVDASWLSSTVRLNSHQEQITFDPEPSPSNFQLDSHAYQAAILRLAETEIDGTVMVNAPIYRMLSISYETDRLMATFAVSSFADYALTSDLMETELIDTIAGQQLEAATGHPTPLRDQYLPSAQSVHRLETRQCAGGPAALLAIARPAYGKRPADYALLIQERSGLVLNAAGKLAVIPKAFHQPIGEPSSEVDLATTVIREFEEELLGRDDLEQLSTTSWRQADALHNLRLSQPMEWLLQHQGNEFRIECTGFGYNLITGTYEFSCLIVVDDESWWEQWGHLVEANWETMRIHRYSSQDPEALAALAHDPRWSNEGLFAYLQGLRRLAEIGSDHRLSLPPIHVKEISN